MGHKFFQACYAHPDTGWDVIHASAGMPPRMLDDFSAVERGNAAAASDKPVPMGENETPTCMYEIYCRNDAVGLVRVQYGLSDGQGRPVSFAHGYLFPDAYELLKHPNALLCIQKENFADQRVSDEQRLAIRSTPGAVNRALIENSAPELAPAELSVREPFTLQGALLRCRLYGEAYATLLMAVYSHLLSSHTEKNLYVKTDGSEEHAQSLLYLIYSGVPYSMRPLLSASTCLHARQHNTKLIFCADVPGAVPWIDPVSGENNVMSKTVEKRLRDRSPFVEKALESVMCGKQDQFFAAMEACLRFMGNERLHTMQQMNLAYSFGKGEYDLPERLPGILYGWLSLAGQDTADWENAVCLLLKKAVELSVDVGEESRRMLSSHLKTARTEKFIDRVGAYLALFDGRK